jgi:predicted CxxxxCH...CXXCH cytochrome family protein
MHSTTRYALAAIAAASLLAGCSKARTVQGLGSTTVEVPLGDPTGGSGGPTGRIDLASCTACHGTPGFTASGADPLVSVAPPAEPQSASSTVVGAHRAHLVDGAISHAVECSSCHLVPTTGGPHKPASVVSFSRRATTIWSGGHLTPTYVAGTCSGTYCHGNFKNGGNVTVTWASTTPVVCGSCHGVGVDGPGGTHPKGVGTACGNCHGAGYSSTTVNLATHMNGVLDLPSMSCSGCHGDGARVAVPSATGKDVDGNPLVRASPPIDTQGSSSSTAVGAHLAHVNQNDTAAPGPLSNAISCAICHTVPTSKSHSNGTVGVTFTGLATTGGASPTWTSPSCTATYCHGNFPGGNGSGAVAWTGTTKLGCTACHGNPPPASVGHPQNTACATCHGSGYSTTTVNVATHVNGTVDLVAAESCTSCHGQAGRASGSGTGGAFDANQAAAPPVDTHGASSGVLVGVHLAHVNPSAGNVYKPIACTECHPDNAGKIGHANGTVNLTFSAATGANLGSFTPTFTQGNGTSTATSCAVYCHGASLGVAYAGSVATWTWTGAAASCGSCHGDPPSTGGHAGLTSSSNCGGCHPGYTATTVNLALHINGQLDGGFESSGGVACGACHATIFNLMNGVTATVSKHTLGSVAGTNDSFTDSGQIWNPQATLAGVPPANRSCVNMCHGDHPHTINTDPTHSYNLYLDPSTSSARVNGGTTTASNRANEDFDPATNTGLCVRCHVQPIVAGGITVDGATFGASAHDFTSTAAPAVNWQYTLHSGTTSRNCTKCHASRAEGTTPTANGSGTVAVHGTQDDSLLSGTKRAGATPFVCWNCHGSTASPAAGAQGDRSGKNLQAEFAKAGNHPIASDTVHDSVAEATDTYNSGKFRGTNRHVNCLDCHDPHAAGKTKHPTGASSTNAIGADSPIQSVTGVSFNTTGLANWSPTTGTQLTWTAAATFEYQICFKCHSSWAFGTTPPTDPNVTAVPPGGNVMTDVAQEFNPGNASGHPVVAPNTGHLLQALKMANGWTTGQTMSCSDCHASDDAAGIGGPHGSTAATKMILKGPNTLWPFQSNGTTPLNLGTDQTNNFCSNCHDVTQALVHRDHGYACTVCHIRVPHGGKIPRLLATPTAGLPARYQLSGWPPLLSGVQAGPYSGLEIGRSNCSAACGSHSATGTVTW